MRPTIILEPFGVPQLLRFLNRAFSNLDRRQQLASVLRLGSSLFVIICVGILLSTRDNPTKCHISRIKCGHLDVALGLYNTLRNSMASSYTDSAGELIPIDSGLTDSEITILTEYTEREVTNAPQYIDLGVHSWCTYNYVTDFSEKNYIRTNLTTVCLRYGSLSAFDFRTILHDVGLDIILAYAYQSYDKTDAEYTARVQSHARAFRILTTVAPIQLTCHVVLILGGIFVYYNKDKRRLRLIAMNVLAVISIIAAIAISVATAIVLRVIGAEKAEVESGLGSFGIHLVSGKFFFTLLWLIFGSSIYCMLTWTGPLWCSNVPDDQELRENETRYASKSSTAVSDYKVKPYVLHRHTKAFNPATRLFDEDLEDGISCDAETESDSIHKTSSDDDATESTRRVHSEHELRQLGETLTRDYSVRKVMHPQNAARFVEHLPQKSETHDLLYGNNPFSNHQYPQPFPRPTDASSVSRSSSTLNRENSVRTRLLLKADNMAPTDQLRKHDNIFADDATAQADNMSLLDETEMAYLDNNHFVNRMDQPQPH